MAITVTEDPIVPLEKTYSIHGITSDLMWSLGSALTQFLDSNDFDSDEEREKIHDFLEVVRMRNELRGKKKKRK